MSLVFLCKGSVTGLPCPLDCPAAMWAGRGANKRLFSGGTTVRVWKPEGGENETGHSDWQWEKWIVCAQAPVLQAAGAFAEHRPRRWNCVMDLRQVLESLSWPSPLLLL